MLLMHMEERLHVSGLCPKIVLLLSLARGGADGWILFPFLFVQIQTGAFAIVRLFAGTATVVVAIQTSLVELDEVVIVALALKNAVSLQARTT